MTNTDQGTARGDAASSAPSSSQLADRVERVLDGLAGVSDRGLVHVRNEDAMALDRNAAGLVAVVVSDGVSSSPDPQLASRVAADVTLQALLDTGADPGPASPRRVRTAVAAGARAVEALAAGDEGPACTLVAAVIDPGGTGPAATGAGADTAGGPQIIVAWVGDSRAYWLDAAGVASRVLTNDHSWAVEVVAAGRLDAASAALDRRAHAITRWLGAGGEPIPELALLVPEGPGVLLLCTDGLWNYLPAAEDLAAVALPRALRDPAGAAAALTDVAIEAGGRDNITVALVPVLRTAPAAD